MRMLGHMMVAIGMLAAAISLSSTATFAKNRVALIVGPTQDKYIGSWTQTFERVAKTDGLKVTIFSSPFDPAEQARQIEEAVGQKFDLLVVQPISQQAIIPAMMRAKEANIPALAITAEPTGDLASLVRGYIGENSYELGWLAGETLAKMLVAAGNENGRVAAITGIMAEGAAPVRFEGFKAALAKIAPKVQLVAAEDVHWDPVVGEQTAGQLIARFSADGGLDGFYGMNDTLANSVIQAAVTAGIALGNGKGQLAVVGGNCQAPGIRNLNAGKMQATVLMLPAVSAARAAKAAKELLAGNNIEAKMYEDHVAITADNVREYAEACSY